MSLEQRIARNLEEPAKILGLSPMELATCAVSYAVLSSILRGVPYSTLLSLSASALITVGFLVLNRTYPPYHGVLSALRLLRPQIHPVMKFGMSKERL
jgi:hypothetical protein